MVAPGIPSQTPNPYFTTLRLCAFAVTAVSSICAVVALIAGSALEFGVAMALSAGWFIAADFIESSVEGRRAAHPGAVRAGKPNRAADPCRVLFIGGDRTAPPVSRRAAIRYH